VRLRLVRFEGAAFGVEGGHARWYDPSLSGAFDVLACCGDDFFDGCNDVARLGPECMCCGPRRARSGEKLRRR
jgi:hypothetical protein